VANLKDLELANLPTTTLAAVAVPGVVQLPLDTARDRSLWHAGGTAWHAGGTAGENDEARTWRRRFPARPEGEARPR
jgi:hypothetical protein